MKCNIVAQKSIIISGMNAASSEDEEDGVVLDLNISQDDIHLQFNDSVIESNNPPPGSGESDTNSQSEAAQVFVTNDNNSSLDLDASRELHSMKLNQSASAELSDYSPDVDLAESSIEKEEEMIADADTSQVRTEDGSVYDAQDQPNDRADRVAYRNCSENLAAESSLDIEEEHGIDADADISLDRTDVELNVGRSQLDQSLDSYSHYVPVDLEDPCMETNCEQDTGKVQLVSDTAAESKDLDRSLESDLANRFEELEGKIAGRVKQAYDILYRVITLKEFNFQYLDMIQIFFHRIQRQKLFSFESFQQVADPDPVVLNLFASGF